MQTEHVIYFSHLTSTAISPVGLGLFTWEMLPFLSQSKLFMLDIFVCALSPSNPLNKASCPRGGATCRVKTPLCLPETTDREESS